MNQNQNQTKPELPNSTAVLILGILSLVFALMSCLFWPMVLIGMILAAISLFMAMSAVKTNRQFPNAYSGYGNIQGGRICAIITLVIVGLYLLLILVGLLFFASMLSGLPGFH